MGNAKATDVLILRKIVAKAGPQFEQRLIDGLSPEARVLYQDSFSTSWAPTAVHAQVYSAAARLLFPGKRDDVEQLGAAMAEQAYSGVYRFFLQIPTLEWVLKRGATVWRTYHDTGALSVKRINEQAIEITVADYTDLQDTLLRTAAGHYKVIAERTGCKSVEVKIDRSKPAAWRWLVTYKI